MRPQAIGRTLGIGLRVAGRMAGQRLAAASQPAAPQAVAAATAQAAKAAGNAGRAAAPAAGQAKASTGGGVVRGVGGFLRPFRRVGGILWLEVTGVFFLLPVMVFAPALWRARLSYAHGPDHRTFWVSALVVVVFLYLGLSSFWRARRR